MNAFHLGTEIRRFAKGKLPPLALLVIMLMPLLFGGLFVWAYWNPVGRAKDLPVALVNSDQGTTVNGEKLNAGEQITTKLLDQSPLDFHLVSPEAARNGVADGTYYFAIELPTDFSEAVASADTDTPHQANLNAVFNNHNGQLAMTIGNLVLLNLLEQINAQLGEQVVGNLLVGFNTIGEGLGQAGDGAGQLADGTGTAETGAQKLADGSTELADGIASADEGAQQLADGAQELHDGIGTAATGADELAAGMAKLNAATEQLGTGAGQISDGVNTLTGAADGVVQAQQDAVGVLVNLSAQLRTIGAVDLANQTDALITQIQGGVDGQSLGSQLDALRAGAAELHRQLSDPASEYLSGMQTATDGAAQLATGLHTLDDGSERLVIGAQTLAEGTSKLSAGSQQLTVGASQLASGLVELDAGAEELALKLNESAEKIPSFADNAKQSIAQPVAKNLPGDSLGLFGLGLAPIFTSLGLFMGATVIFMLLAPVNRRAVDAGMSPLRAAMTAYLPAMVVGIVQVTLMYAVQHWLIGLEPTSMPMMYLAMCLISMTFVALAQMLNALLGDKVGRVLCIALMSLQITASGGIYPVETQPRFFSWVHPFDPMTYSTNLLRGMVYGLDHSQDPRPQHAAMVLVCLLISFLLVTALAMWRNRRWRMKDLHPEIHI